MEINVDVIKDNMKENFDRAAEFTIQKTGEIITLTKLRIRKTDLKIKIKDRYRVIGKLVYSNFREDNDISDKIEALVTEIDELKVKLAECIEAIESFKD